MAHNGDKRRFVRIALAGVVSVGGHDYPLRDLSPCGGALMGADVWWEDDVASHLSIPCGAYEFTLRRVLRACHADTARGVVGFEFMGINGAQTDIVLGLMLARSSDPPWPPVLSGTNRRALAWLQQCGQVDCPEGAWSAHLRPLTPPAAIMPGAKACA